MKGKVTANIRPKGAAVKKSSTRTSNHFKNYQLYLLLILPVLYFIMFKYIPMYGAAIAFKDYNIFQGILGSEWVGFENFRQLFAMSQFYKVVRNTLLLNFLDLSFSFPMPIILAILLNELRGQWFKKRGANDLVLAPFYIMGHHWRTSVPNVLHGDRFSQQCA